MVVIYTFFKKWGIESYKEGEVKSGLQVLLAYLQ